MPELFVHSIQSLFRLGIRLPGVGCPFAKCYLYLSEESYHGKGEGRVPFPKTRQAETDEGGGAKEILTFQVHQVFPLERPDW